MATGPRGFKDFLNESVNYNRWQKMDDKALRHEYDIEYTIKPLKSMTGDVWPTFEDFKKAYKAGEVTRLTKSLDRQVSYRSNTTSKEDLIDLIKGYASYPKYRNEKTIDGIFKAFEDNQPMNMPIVLRFRDGRLRIMGGNTRLDIAFMMGLTPKVVIVDAYKKVEESTVLDEFDQLDESLNSPVETYMTEDTRIPDAIHAAFEIDSDKYLISLVRSSKSGIYLAELNRIVNVNKRLWSFKKTSHIRPALSTFVYVIQASLMFIQSQVKGITISVPKNVASPRFNTFTKRLIKRALVSKFEDVPVKYNDYFKGGKSFIFIIKKGYSPNTVFKTKAYKGYDFGVNAETLDELEPKRRIPRKPNLKPSAKYHFKGYEVSLVDTEEGRKVFDISNKLKAKTIELPPNEKVIEYQTKLEQAQDQLKKYLDDGKTDLASLLAAVGFSRHLSTTTVKNFLSKEGSKPSFLKKVLLDDNGELKDEQLLKKTLDSINFIRDTKDGLKLYSQIVSKYNELESLSYDIQNSTKSRIKADVDLEFPLPEGNGFSEIVFSEVNHFAFTPKQQKDVNTRELYFLKLGYEESISKAKKEHFREFSSVFKYTGTDYAYINTLLRGNYSKDVKFVDKSDFEHVKNIISFMERIGPLKAPTWVFRNANIPNVQDYGIGDDIIDPGFMSTSLNEEISYGSSGNSRLTIYLPEGAHVLPILTFSDVNHEKEVILPPMSIIRPVEIAEVGDKHHIKAVYIGNAANSYIDTLQQYVVESMRVKSFGEFLMNEAKKGQKTADGKWSTSLVDKDTMKSISDKIKKGELTVKKPDPK